MKISTEISSSARVVGEERAVYNIAKAGFDAWDFSMCDMARINWNTWEVIESNHPLRSDDYAKFAKKLRKIGEDNGIVCNQSHAPFPVAVPGVRSYLKRSIECTAIAGGEYCIIHPDNNKSAEENAEMFNELLPFAKECGVKIATENMWNWNNEKDEASAAACSSHEDFVKHIDAVNDPYLVACLDIGHAEMKGLGTSAREMILALGYKRLKALHIHDNDRWHDSHQLIYTMQIDLDLVARTLKEIGYDGYFTLECDNAIKTLGAKNEEELLAALKKMAELTRRMAKVYEDYKPQ